MYLFKTSWVNKDGENKKIKKDELDNYINNGWLKGKVPKISIENIMEIKTYYDKCNSYKKTAIKFGIPKSSVVNYIKRYD